MTLVQKLTERILRSHWMIGLIAVDVGIIALTTAAANAGLALIQKFDLTGLTRVLYPGSQSFPIVGGGCLLRLKDSVEQQVRAPSGLLATELSDHSKYLSFI